MINCHFSIDILTITVYDITPLKLIENLIIVYKSKKDIYPRTVEHTTCINFQFTFISFRSSKLITQARDTLIRSDNVQASRKVLNAFLRRFRQSGNIIWSPYLFM